MIWACDAEGRATYLSPEWLGLTGQTRANAENWGWLEAVHEDDQEVVRAIVLEALGVAADFTVTFRVRRSTGEFVWVVGGAMPSFSPQDGNFLGFLGSVSEAPKLASKKAAGQVGYYHPLPPTPLTQPHTALDLITDHLLMARSLAADAGEDMLRSIIDMSLLETGQRLAKSQRDERCALN
jgi:PAS domain S-box-containing protein